ncbi:MAG: ABC transporter substrate-binding protein [Pseudomonadota bacterium]
MRFFVLFFFLLLSAACGVAQNEQGAAAEGIPPPESAREIPMPHAITFKVYERDGYRIVDFKAPVIGWGGSAQRADQTERIVLAPKDGTPPELVGDLGGAVLVRTPVERIAVNYGTLEAILSNLGVSEKLVAIGGVKSYNDDIRARARSGELAQIGYGWHVPPEIDTLLGAEPDVFFDVIGVPGHEDDYERIKRLGVPIVPIFHDAELTYLGPVDYVRLVGMFVDREEEADAFAAMVARNVEELKAKVANKTKRKAMNAWFAGSGRWMVTVRNADNQLLTDAGGLNPMARPDDARIDDYNRVGSEVLLENARDIDCWIIRDTHSQTFTDKAFLQNFKAWREGCVFAIDGSVKPDADAFDYYETAIIRPDLKLRDLIRMLHPDVTSAPYVYFQPDSKTPRP